MTTASATTPYGDKSTSRSRSAPPEAYATEADSTQADGTQAYGSHAPGSIAPAFIRRTESPLGRIELTSDGASITSLSIECGGVLPWDDFPEHTAPVLEAAVSQLAEYFDGRRTQFDLPIAVEGTAFQKQIWTELSLLPFGSVVSYGFLGGATGRASAGRAVGGAVGANPVPIIVPCHRVLATNGRITGFSAGEGIATKAWLLDHEGVAHRS